MVLLTLVLIAVIIGFFIQRSRVKELEELVQQLITSMPSKHELEGVSQRVRALETAKKAGVKSPDLPVSPAKVPPSDYVPPEAKIEIATPAPPVHREPESAYFEETVEPELFPPVRAERVENPAEAPLPEPHLSTRIRQRFANEEWEALVGGSVINKIGAIVLVIGIALFLGYSFVHFGRVGRASLSIAVSTALLFAGIVAGKRPRFSVFSRGLIGAGWAALYATAYAIYAVPEARIIDNPFLGSLILLAVAGGMVGHSLRYRVQAVTGVAYFAAFAALAITPATPFAVISLVPLAASILYLAWKFDWYPMALFGSVATYLTCVSKADPHATLAGTQTILVAYWLLFESFDLLRTHRRVTKDGVEWISVANAAGFLGISFLAWSAHAPDRLWQAAAYAAALYLVSAIARAFIRPPASFENGESLLTRVRAGSFEGSVLVSATLTALSIFGRVPGIWSSFGLALEAELIYLAGVVFASAFLRRVGARSFSVSLLRLALSSSLSAHTLVLHHDFWNWTPGAILHASLFYLNRGIRKQAVLFSYLAAGLVALVLAAEVPEAYAAGAWALFGMLLLEFGFKRKLFEFRAQGYALLMFGFAGTAGLPLLGIDPPPLVLAACLAIAYSVALQVQWFPSAFEEPGEPRPLALGSAAAVVVMSALLFWRIVPVSYLSIAWWLLTCVLLELGFRRLSTDLRRSLLPMIGLSSLSVAFTHLPDLHHLPPFPIWATYTIASGCCVWIAIRLFRCSRERSKPGESLAQDLVCVLGAVFVLTLSWLIVALPLVSLTWMLLAILIIELARKFERKILTPVGIGVIALAYSRVLLIDIGDHTLLWTIPVRVLTIPLFVALLYWVAFRYRSSAHPRLSRVAGWIALGPAMSLILVQAGFRNAAFYWAVVAVSVLAYGIKKNNKEARYQSYVVSAATILLMAAFDLYPARLWITLPVIGILYASRFLARDTPERHAPTIFSLSATLLLSAMLYGWVSGEMLTVAWGLQSMLLLIAGFSLRDRIFRLQGLALLLICTLKLFLYDLRNLETLPRILSFIVLGVILLSVSWIYSRFREHIRKIL